MRKVRLLATFIMLIIFALSFNHVKATELLEDDAAVVTSIELKQLKTGTAPWDDNDEAGNDSSADNLVVRSFDQVVWTVENTMEIRSGEEKYTGGKIFFEVSIPEGFTSETFKWDLGSMSWIEGAKLSEDGMTLTGYYSMKTTDTTVPGKQNLIFAAKVLGAKNGSKLNPIFKTWLNGNTEDEYCTTKFDKEITVSAKPSYNVLIRRNTYCENRTTVELDGKQVTGRMFGYVVILQLYSADTSRGLKGIEYPTGEFLTDINLKLYKSVKGKNVDVTSEANPILWQYYIAGKGFNGGFIEEREVFGGNSNYIVNGANLTPNGNATSDRKRSIYNSGTPTMEQEENIIHMSVKDYEFDGTFPIYNRDNSDTDAIIYPENVGCFSAIQFQVFVPDFDSYDSSSTYYLEVSDENMQATSRSGISTNNQQNIADDKTSAQYFQHKKGGYNNFLFIVERKKDNFWVKQCSSGWGTGDSRVFRDQEVSLSCDLRQTESNDEECKIQAINNLLKFDGDCYQPVVLDDGTQFNNTAEKQMQFKIWYATKKDGTNWSSQEEMNKATTEDLVYYKSLDDIPEGYICTGVYMESTGGKLVSTGTRIDIPMVIKETANIGQTYGATQIPVYYTEPLDRSIYTIENPNVQWPKNYVFKNQRNYIKSEFDNSGTLIKGTHYSGITWGNTAQVIGAKQSITIEAINAETNEKKTNYDMSKNEYNVTYKVTPALKNPVNESTLGESDVTVNAVVTLPKGMTYVAGSSNYGDPDLVENDDGTITLTWTIYNCTVNKEIEPVIFEGHINEENSNGTQLVTNAEINADVSKIGPTRYEDRIAQTSVQVIDLAAHRLYKTVEVPVIEKNGDIHYSISYKNNTDEVISDFQLLDILPYNGDSRGTSFSGTYKVTKIVIKQKDENGDVLSSNENLKLYCTTDETARNATAKDENLGDGWTLTETQSIMSTLTAFALKGEVGTQGLVSVDIYMTTSGNKSDDKYVNSASTQVYSTTNAIVTSDVIAQIVSRKIEGIVWYDTNYNGIMDDDEQRVSNVKMILTDGEGNSVTDVDGNVVSELTTDENGYYCFKSLRASDYYVKIVMPESKYTLTEKEVGMKATVNSKFNQENETTDLITKLNSKALPNLIVTNQNAGLIKKQTKVVVNYKEDETDRKLYDEITIDGRVDDEYTTEDKIDEINTANNNEYEFVRVEGNTTGNMTEDVIYVTYYYKKIKGSVTITKVDKDNTSKLLQGAVFKIEKLDDNGNIDTTFKSIEKTTSSSGIAVFDELIIGKYRITEIKAPNGYELLQSSIDVEIDKDNREMSYTLVNKKKLDLPDTGGKNFIIYTSIVGLVTIGASLVLNKKKVKNRA